MKDYNFEQAHDFTSQWYVNEENNYHISQNSKLTVKLEDYISSQCTQWQKVSSYADGCNTFDLEEKPYTIVNNLFQDNFRNYQDHKIKDFLYDNIWKKLHCKSLPLALSLVFYDTAVHMGINHALVLLESSCNIVGEAHLDDFSPLSLKDNINKAAIKLSKNLQTYHLDFYTARLFLRQRKQLYLKLIKQKQDCKSLADNCEKRHLALLEYLAEFERDIY